MHAQSYYFDLIQIYKSDLECHGPFIRFEVTSCKLIELALNLFSIELFLDVTLFDKLEDQVY